ncbi:MAG: helix-turn-helix transcriptional regulator [Acidobacteriota bacterium]
MMTIPTAEERAASLLREVMTEQQISPAALAAASGLEADLLSDVLAARRGLDLPSLERVLRALELDPGSFFARLYTPEPAAPPTPSDEPLPREELETLMLDLRKKIDGMVRLLDAEAAAEET